MKIVQILAPLTHNLNAQDTIDSFGNTITPIHVAAYKGHTEIVKILAPLTDQYGRTPIWWAAFSGYIDISSFQVFHFFEK